MINITLRISSAVCSMEGIGKQTIWTEVQGQAILGEEEFADKLIGKTLMKERILKTRQICA